MAVLSGRVVFCFVFLIFCDKQIEEKGLKTSFYKNEKEKLHSEILLPAAYLQKSPEEQVP